MGGCGCKNAAQPGDAAEAVDTVQHAHKEAAKGVNLVEGSALQEKPQISEAPPAAETPEATEISNATEAVKEPEVAETSQQSPEVAEREALGAPAPPSLEDRFNDAASVIAKGKPTKGAASNDEKLKLYGLFKQAKQGDCRDAEPWKVQLEKYAKWSAWSAHKGKSAEQAMGEYVEEVARQVREYGIEAPR